MEFEKALKIGLIQTTLDYHTAWLHGTKYPVNMQETDQEYVWTEIKKGFSFLKDHNSQPHIVLLPELTTPECYIKELERLSCKLNVITIAGIDFISKEKKYVQNRAIIIIPNRWLQKNKAYSATIKFFGKTYFSYGEKEYFLKKEMEEYPDSNMYVINSNQFGRIGVAICSDFFDIERFQIYRGQIQHMFILAYNQDIQSFYNLAASISRMVYCNVVICNTGYYGGSVAYSPYYDSFRRTIYKHEGKRLFTSQVIEIPVKDLVKAQETGNFKDGIFKAQPPGYKQNMLNPEIISFKI